MREFDLKKTIFLDTNGPAGVVRIKPEWDTQVNADGVSYVSDKDRILIPWGTIYRVRQPLREEDVERAAEDGRAERGQRGRPVQGADAGKGNSEAKASGSGG